MSVLLWDHVKFSILDAHFIRLEKCKKDGIVGLILGLFCSLDSTYTQIRVQMRIYQVV